MKTPRSSQFNYAPLALAISAAVGSGLYSTQAAAAACSPVGTTYVVTTSAGDTSDGSFRNAVSLANENAGCDKIVFDENVTSIALEAGAIISDWLIIEGHGEDTLNISNSAGTAITSTSWLYLQDLTISGSVDGISQTYNSFDLKNVTVKDNSGTGIFIDTANPISFDNVTAQNNQARGVEFTSTGTSSTFAVDNSLFASNGSTADGAGMYLKTANGDNITITNSNFVGNTTSSNGGGLAIDNDSYSANVTLENNSFYDNKAVDGAGIYVTTPVLLEKYGNLSLVMRQNTISGNTASGAGGGIMFEGHTISTMTARIESTTVARNSANAGGGITVNSGSDVTNTITLRNSVIALNTGAEDNGFNVRGEFDSAVYSWIGENRGSGAATYTASPSGDTTLEGDESTVGICNLADNGGTTPTHLLTAESPLLDAGDPAAVEGSGAGEILSTDQRGEARVNTTLDIGALERAASDEGASCQIGSSSKKSSGGSSAIGAWALGLLGGLLFWRRRK